MKTFPTLSTSTVQGAKSCSSWRNSPRTLNSPTWWITFDGALRVLVSLKSFDAKPKSHIHEVLCAGPKEIARVLQVRTVAECVWSIRLIGKSKSPYPSAFRSPEYPWGRLLRGERVGRVGRIESRSFYIGT